MSLRVNFRTDNSWDPNPRAEPGDMWRIFWHHEVDGQQVDDHIAGYAICCPTCKHIHHWTSASNCSTRGTGGSCSHQTELTSCWNWTGSAEEGTLSATPSLHCPKELGGCGWHGYLTNGELKEV